MTVSEAALVTIAAATSLQALVSAALGLSAVTAARKARQAWREEAKALHAALDGTLSQVGAAAASVERMTSRAGLVADDAGRMLADVGGALRTVTSTVSAPKALLAAGAAAGARGLVRWWRHGGHFPKRV